MEIFEHKVMTALRWIDEHGELVDAPFPDNEVADLFKAMAGRHLIHRRKDRWALTENGLRHVGSIK